MTPLVCPSCGGARYLDTWRDTATCFDCAWHGESWQLVSADLYAAATAELDR